MGPPNPTLVSRRTLAESFTCHSYTDSRGEATSDAGAFFVFFSPFSPPPFLAAIPSLRLANSSLPFLPPNPSPLRATSAAASLGTGPAPSPKLIARAFLKLGQWRWAIAEDMDDRTVTDVLTAFRTATDACRQWAKAWHHWALFNAAAMEHYAKDPRTRSACLRHVAPAISGFFRSIALGGAAPQKGKGGPLQDILRLLTLWFNHGAAPEVEAALMEGTFPPQVNVQPLHVSLECLAYPSLTNAWRNRLSGTPGLRVSL